MPHKLIPCNIINLCYLHRMVFRPLVCTSAKRDKPNSIFNYGIDIWINISTEIT